MKFLDRIFGKKQQQPQSEIKKITCEKLWKKYEKFYTTLVKAKLRPYDNFVSITKEEYVENEVLYQIGLDLGIIEHSCIDDKNILKEKYVPLVKGFRDKLLKNPDKIIYYEVPSDFFSIDGIYYSLDIVIID